MGNFFRVRNFERFQHYKDRNPPWIRLYGALWRDRAFFRLPDALKAHLIGLFALAARLDNRIPDDPEWLAHELCATEPIDLKALLASGFLVPEHPASSADAGCKTAAPCSASASESQSASDLIEAGSDSCADAESGASQKPHGEPDFHPIEGRRGKRAEVRWPAGLALDEEMRRFAQRLGVDAEAEFEAWRDDCAAHDRRYADWRAAWRGRCRNAVRFRAARASRGAPAHSAMETALRRLREASERERSGAA